MGGNREKEKYVIINPAGNGLYLLNQRYPSSIFSSGTLLIRCLIEMFSRKINNYSRHLYYYTGGKMRSNI